MDHAIIGALITLGLGLLKNWRHYSKIKEAAKVIVEDETNPITDPKEALKQVLIKHDQERIEKMAAELAEMQLDAKRDEEAARARGLEASCGMDITRVDPNTGEETKVDTSCEPKP